MFYVCLPPSTFPIRIPQPTKVDALYFCVKLMVKENFELFSPACLDYAVLGVSYFHSV